MSKESSDTKIMEVVINAFIDSQNVNLSIRDQGWPLDFGRFRKYLADKYGVKKAYLFIGYIRENEGLYTNLQKDGFILVFKPTLTIKGGAAKGNIDAELVLHAMIEWLNYDKAVIITGDGDFACLIDYFIQKGKLLKLIVPNRRKYSALLKKFRPYIAFMIDLEVKLG